MSRCRSIDLKILQTSSWNVLLNRIFSCYLLGVECETPPKMPRWKDSWGGRLVPLESLYCWRCHLTPAELPLFEAQPQQLTGEPLNFYCMPSSSPFDSLLRILILQFNGNEFQPLAFALLSNSCKIAQVLWRLPKKHELQQTFGKYCYKFQMLLGVFPTALGSKGWKLSKAGKCI